MTPILESLRHCDFVSGRGVVRGLAVAVALAVVGCTTIGPNLVADRPELAGPFPEDYSKIVRHWIDSDFGDISTVTSLWVSKPTVGSSQRFLVSQPLNGWYVKVTFKARDSLGATKGKMAYAVLLRDGEVVASRKLLY